MSLISTILFLPLAGVFLLLFVPNWKTQLIRRIALNTSLLTFLISLLLWIEFDSSTARFQYFETLTHSGFASELTSINGYSFSSLNFLFGVDGISLFFIILTTFLIPICILVSWTSIQAYVKEYCIAFLVLESLMIAVFSVLDLLLFYVFFESVLIPMFVIIGVWGSRERKIRAAYQFFLYTLLGSVFMLLAILLIYFQTGTTDLEILYCSHFSETRQLFLWFAFFASFAVKVPMVPVHIWLPEAHVEAPTAGSVILAGILLKLGTYGFLRFSIPLFPFATFYFTPLIYTLSVLAIIYTSLTTLRQIDLKKIIAYSSVAHMNFVTLGLFSLNTQGIEGSILLMLSHGLVSPALFLCIGILYDRHKTRLLRYYAGCGRTMPIFAFLFVFFTLANISLPGTSSFIGEFLVLTGTYQNNTLVAMLAATGMVLGAAYALWLCNRLVYGVIKPHFINEWSDVTRREFWMLAPFVVSIIWMGVYPEPFLDAMHCSVSNLISHGM
uniref:NADH-ubiquinone oxidoreductase chain 4 n=2 Tax=Chlorella clade TaxID=2511126 RepID=U5U824_9CHLO|nr:NADH dehydrogenase subunit 4 [Micractinium variabile]AGZ19401.1 NADH dehydrogenase subunit 4 [Chlorella sp. ArM0029B]QTK15925.1 NADH dehydrogenase subunit 4 [Micractinium variabile]